MPQQPNLFDEPLDQQKEENFDQKIETIKLRKDSVDMNYVDLVPDTALLALTRQYGIQAIHISKILNYLHKKDVEEQGINREDISNEFSMTWARTQGTLNVVRKIGLITSHNKLTNFGNLVLKESPYIDNSGLLWLFHYILASNANLVLWSYLFNFAFYKREEISIQEITQDLSVLSGRWSENSLKEKVPGETGGILKSYTEGFLNPINLITKLNYGTYECGYNTSIIPTLIWLAAILIYRDQYYPGATSLEVPLIVDANYSPARILRQGQLEIRKSLDELHNGNFITVETRSGLDQVRFKREVNWLSVMADYLKGK